MTPLSLLALWAFAAGCPESWKPEYAAAWELSQDTWRQRCAAGTEPAAILVEAQKAFMLACEKEAAAAVAAGLTDAATVKALCAQGVPGRNRIPRGASPGGETTKETASPVSGGALGEGAKAIAAAGTRIGSFVSGDVAGLYGERTADAGAVVDGAPDLNDKTKPQEQQPGATAPQKGFKVESVPDPPYEPTDKARAPYLKVLDGRILDNGAGKEAVSYARTLYRDMLEKMDPDVLKELVNKKVHLAIIPKGKKLTEIPHFSSLKGQKTFDGRDWGTVRGAANMPMDGGGVAAAVGEETLLDRDPKVPGHAKGFTFTHEYGHLVQRQGLKEKNAPAVGYWAQLLRSVRRPVPSYEDIKALYDENQKRPEKGGLGAYADSNEREFFAEATAAYFGRSSDGSQTPDTLKKSNPKMYAILERIYGPPGRFKGK